MSFIYDGTSIATKTNLTALPGGADPTKWFQASDWTTLRTAHIDTRTAILAGRLHGFTGEATRPVVSGTTHFLWEDSDDSLPYFYNGTTDWLAVGRVIRNDAGGLAQRLALHFLTADFAVADDAGGNETDISLANTAVTPGAYTAANITVDAKGRVTAAANGTGGGHTIRNDGGDFTARTGLHFLTADFVVADDAGGNETDVSLANPMSPKTLQHGTAGTFPVVINKTGAAQANNSLLDLQRGGSAMAWLQLDASDNLELQMQTGKTLLVTGPSTIAVDNATTNAVTNAMTVRHTTSGTAVAGIGVGIAMQSEDGAGGTDTVADISAVLGDVTAASEDGYIRFRAVGAGALADSFYAHPGAVGIGLGTSVPFCPLHVSTSSGALGQLIETTDATNDSVINLLTVHRYTSHASNGAAGIGAGIAFQAEDASGNISQPVGDIAGVLSVATHGSEKGYIQLRAINGAGSLAAGLYAWGTGRVGIGTGTTEPTESLEITSGNARINGMIGANVAPTTTTAAFNLKTPTSWNTSYPGMIVDTLSGTASTVFLVDIKRSGTIIGQLYADGSDAMIIGSPVGVSLATSGAVKFAVNSTGVGFYATTPVARSATPFTLNAGTLAHDLPSGATAAQIEQCLRQLLTYLGDVSGSGLINVTA